MNGLADVLVIRIPMKLADDTQSFLRTAGRAGLEGLVLWAGRRDGSGFDVTDVLIPKQRGIRTPDGVCVVVDGDEMRRLNMHLYQSGLELIAQVHSHPDNAYHSDMDDEYAIATTVGCLSLVVPDFAKRAFRLGDCAVYRLQRDGTWEELQAADAGQLIRLE